MTKAFKNTHEVFDQVHDLTHQRQYQFEASRLIQWIVLSVLLAIRHPTVAHPNAILDHLPAVDKWRVADAVIAALSRQSTDLLGRYLKLEINKRPLFPGHGEEFETDQHGEDGGRLPPHIASHSLTVAARHQRSSQCSGG